MKYECDANTHCVSGQNRKEREKMHCVLERVIALSWLQQLPNDREGRHTDARNLCQEKYQRFGFGARQFSKQTVCLAINSLANH